MYSREYENEWERALVRNSAKITPTLVNKGNIFNKINIIKDRVIQLFTKNTARCRHKNVSIPCESCPMIKG